MEKPTNNDDNLELEEFDDADFDEMEEFKEPGLITPQDSETEANLLNFLEKQQGKNQSIQSLIDYIPDELFYLREHQLRYNAILSKHKQERRKDIPQQQAYWLSDLIDLKKKRELLNLIGESFDKLYSNKQSFKIIKARLVAQIEAI
jgi:replicative DNA helicase